MVITWTYSSKGEDYDDESDQDRNLTIIIKSHWSRTHAHKAKAHKQF